MKNALVSKIGEIFSLNLFIFSRLRLAEIYLRKGGHGQQMSYPLA